MDPIYNAMPNDLKLMTMAELSTIMADCRKRERQLLRSESEMIEKMECPTCKRKPTVTGRGLSKVYHVCEHTMVAIRMRAVTVASLGPLERLCGIRIALLDDDGQTGRTR